LSKVYYEQFASLAAQNPKLDFVNLFDEPKDDVFVQDPDTYVAADGLHPSSAGYGIWFAKLLPVLSQNL